MLQMLFVSTTNISVIFLINKNLFIMVNISGKINSIIYFIIFLKKIIYNKIIQYKSDYSYYLSYN